VEDRAAFVDSGGWIAIFDPRDQHHRQATATYERLLTGGTHLVTTNLVLAESYANLRRHFDTARVLRFLDLVQGASRIEMAYSDETLEREAQRILRQYDDQDFSYVDAVSFAVMRERRITTALAFDLHFLVAVFQLLDSA